MDAGEQICLIMHDLLQTICQYELDHSDYSLISDGVLLAAHS
jgi:hypothetical protein